MKTLYVTSTIAACFLAGSCGNPTPSAMTTTRYAMLAGTKTAKDQPMMIGFSIREPGKKSVTFAPLRMSSGKIVSFVSDREFIYPSAYMPAEISTSGMAVTPTTPTGFKSIQTGVEAELTSSRKGGLIVIEGTVTVTEFLGFSRMGGELGRPLLDSKNRVLTENRIEMPMFGTYSTPVYIAMSPGEDYSFEVSHPRKGTKATLRLSPAPR